MVMINKPKRFFFTVHLESSKRATTRKWRIPIETRKPATALKEELAHGCP
jgi:hypothetical protein